jgi:hypothetical protein
VNALPDSGCEKASLRTSQSFCFVSVGIAIYNDVTGVEMLEIFKALENNIFSSFESSKC